MKKNVLEYLEDTVDKYPKRCAYKDKYGEYTFAEVYHLARAIGSRLGSLGRSQRPVAVLMKKSAAAIIGFLGVVYAGKSYCPIDVTLPHERIRQMLSELKPEAVLAEREWMPLAEMLDFGGKVYGFEEICQGKEDHSLLEKIREAAVDTDALYVLFTSGSTGTPKGVVVSHRVILNNMEWLEREFSFGPEDSMGNQAPLSFDIANHDIYCPLKFGCRTVIIPPEYFTFPAKLIPFLQEEKISAVFWAPFALCVAANLKALEIMELPYLRYVFFAGEVMPVKPLNYWRKYVPDAEYVNMYGSTETHITLYYPVKREFKDDEKLPLGKPCGNIGVLVFDEKNTLILPGSREKGELCIRGGAVSLGYYNRLEESRRRFMQNPLNPYCSEPIYRTGDWVSYNEQGELMYHGRMDLQIKHLGYRIELGEIETAAESIPEVEECACKYDERKRQILCFYTGKETERKVFAKQLEKKLPRYMLPGRYIYLKEMPRNRNGKIDRKNLLIGG